MKSGGTPTREFLKLTKKPRDGTADVIAASAQRYEVTKVHALALAIVYM
jgi:hypothetical protein